MLQRIPDSLIRAGYRLEGHLRDDKGRVLFPAGTVLTRVHISRLRSRIITGLYAGDDWPAPIVRRAFVAEEAPLISDQPDIDEQPNPETRRSTVFEPQSVLDDSSVFDDSTVNVATLRIGMHLSEDIYDTEDVLLLAAGQAVTPRFLQLLLQRDIKVVRLRPADETVRSEPESNELAQQLDEKIARLPSVVLRRSTTVPIARLPLSEMLAEAKRGLERHRETSCMLANLCNEVQSGQRVRGDHIHDVMNDFFHRLTLDRDLLATIFSMQNSLDEYLFDHCVNVALLSMSVATRLGLNKDQVLTVGMGGVLQDVGMIHVPDTIRLAERSLL